LKLAVSWRMLHRFRNDDENIASFREDSKVLQCDCGKRTQEMAAARRAS
jgi:hypothetical protein